MVAKSINMAKKLNSAGLSEHQLAMILPGARADCGFTDGLWCVGEIGGKAQQSLDCLSNFILKITI